MIIRGLLIGFFFNQAIYAQRTLDENLNFFGQKLKSLEFKEVSGGFSVRIKSKSKHTLSDHFTEKARNKISMNEPSSGFSFKQKRRLQGDLKDAFTTKSKRKARSGHEQESSFVFKAEKTSIRKEQPDAFGLKKAKHKGLSDDPKSAFALNAGKRESRSEMPDHFGVKTKKKNNGAEVDHFSSENKTSRSREETDHFKGNSVGSTKSELNDHFSRKSETQKTRSEEDHFNKKSVEKEHSEKDVTGKARKRLALRKNHVGQRFILFSRDPNRTKSNEKIKKRSRGKHDPFSRKKKNANRPQNPKGENGLFDGRVLPRMEEMRQ